jgi:glycosyltransferase involved in cell wall biosynthesis
LRERFPHRADRVHRIYNGLDLSEFGHADFSSTPPLVIAVGRLISKKGFADLIRICALLVERGKSFRCEIIGEGSLQNELQRQIGELSLQNVVVLAGAKPQTELRRRLAAANVFVLPSVIDPDGGMDNLPTVIMEAMATGLPVVSTNIGGIPEMVIENETGFLVQPGNIAAMAAAIEKVIGDSSFAAKLGHSGYERARRLFSIENNVRELDALIRSDAL